MDWDDLYIQAEENVRDRLGLDDEVKVDLDLVAEEAQEMYETMADDAYESWREAQWT